MTQRTAGAVNAIRRACIAHLAVALPTLLRKNRQATCTMLLIYNALCNGILCKTTQVEMHKYNGRLALQRENVGATNQPQPYCAAISGSSSCLPAKINRCLGGGKTPWSHLSNCICRYFACAKYLIRRNAFFVLDFCLHFFWVQDIAGYQFLPPRYVVEADGTLEFGGLIIFEVLGISGPVPAYPYNDLHLHSSTC